MDKSLYQEFPCDLCGSKSAVEVPHCREYIETKEPIHICRECGFIYVKYRRNAQDIAKTWSEDIYGGVYSPIIPAVRGRLAYVAGYLDEQVNVRDKRLCDIGAGQGQFLRTIRGEEFGAKVFGIEPSSSNCELLNKQDIDNFCGTIEEFRASKKFNEIGKFDIVTVMWTLENCMSCTDMLNSANSLFKKR